MDDLTPAAPTRRDGAGLTGLLVIALIALCVLSLGAGAIVLPLSDVVAGLFGRSEIPAIIIQEIRAPRMALAAGTGAVLGLCGAAAQSLTRNPLAEPALFGTPQAAALGAVLVLYTGAVSAYSPLLSLTAIGFALVSLGAILALTLRHGSALSMLLAGLGVGSLCGAGIAAALSFSSNPYATMEIVFWLMGSFEDRSMRHVVLAFPFFIISFLLILSCRTAYQALTLGEEAAVSLGIDVKATARRTALGIAVGVGAAVSVCGAIGFVGLIAPHMIRKAYGGAPGRILLPSALVGSILLLVADIAVRLLPSNGELRIGVLTAAIGAPWFIYLVARNRVVF